MNKNRRADRENDSILWNRQMHGNGTDSGSTVWKLAWAVVGALFFFVMAYGFGQF